MWNVMGEVSLRTHKIFFLHIFITHVILFNDADEGYLAC